MDASACFPAGVCACVCDDVSLLCTNPVVRTREFVPIGKAARSFHSACFTVLHCTHVQRLPRRVSVCGTFGVGACENPFGCPSYLLHARQPPRHRLLIVSICFRCIRCRACSGWCALALLTLLPAGTTGPPSRSGVTFRYNPGLYGCGPGGRAGRVGCIWGVWGVRAHARETWMRGTARFLLCVQEEGEK